MAGFFALFFSIKIWLETIQIWLEKTHWGGQFILILLKGGFGV
jgi:hypothetical protein